MFGLQTPFEKGPVMETIFPDGKQDEVQFLPQPMLRRVYLAGPISGCDYNTATDWREDTTRELAKYGIQGMSPMRCKSYLSDLADLGVEDVHKMNVTSTPRGIMARDYYDCTNCDVLLVNFLGAPRVSIGTVMEIAWAYQARKPVIVVHDKDGFHDHAMINEAIDFPVATLKEAVDIVKGILVGA